MKSFWKKLPRPFTALAPLDGVTDAVFRQMVTEIGKPDVLFTEFTACGGLVSEGRSHAARNLLFKPNEQPIVAQIWGTEPSDFLTVAQDLRARGFAGIDINMGCPVRAIIKDGSCSALMKNTKLAGEIIQATKKGAKDVPVSVKTRIGFDKTNIKEWIGFLLKQDLAALTVHLRTVAEMSKFPAHWELMPEIVSMRNELAPQTLIIGNGDIVVLSEVEEKFKKYGCEGIMIGRGIFANPWIFNRPVDMKEKTEKARVALFLRHIELFEKEWKGRRKFDPLKKFAKVYLSNFDGAADLRMELMKAKSLEEMKLTLKDYKTS